MKKRITFVGLDTHKNSIEAALADGGRNTEVQLYGTIGGDFASLDKMIRKLQTTGVELRFVYEARPLHNLLPVLICACHFNLIICLLFCFRYQINHL